MTIDERLRRAADDLKAEPAGPVPDLPTRSHTGRMLATWTIAVMLIGGGIWAISTRTTDSSDTRPVSTETGSSPAIDPVTSTATTEPTSSTAPTSSTVVATTGVPVTEPPVVTSPRRLTLTELPEFFGTLIMEPQTVDAVLGTTGTVTYTLAATPSRFCIRHDNGSGCSSTADGSNMFDEPFYLPFIGGNMDPSSGRWALNYLAPLDVQLRLLSNSTPPCELQPFTLEPYAEAALWACESTSPAPFWYTIEAARGDDTIVFEQFNAWGTQVQSGEQMLELMFGAKCLEGADDQPVNFVPRTIDLENVPSPVEATGARIGPYAGQDLPDRHPSEAKYWVSVAIGDEIVGYSYLPNGNLNVPPEQLDSDCHPEVAIYNEQGELIGGFYNSVPAIIDRL
jgi:hypothetical protein